MEKRNRRIVSLQRRKFGGSSDADLSKSDSDDEDARSTSSSSARSSRNSNDDEDCRAVETRRSNEADVRISTLLQTVVREEMMCRLGVAQLEVRLRHRLFSTLSQWIADLLSRLQRESSDLLSTVGGIRVPSGPIVAQPSVAHIVREEEGTTAACAAMERDTALLGAAGVVGFSARLDLALAHQMDAEVSTMPCGVSDDESPREADPSAPLARRSLRASAPADPSASSHPIPPRAAARSMPDDMHRVWCDVVSFGCSAGGRSRSTGQEAVSTIRSPTTALSSRLPTAKSRVAVGRSPMPSPPPHLPYHRSDSSIATSSSFPSPPAAPRQQLSVRQAHDLYFSSVQVVEPFEVRQRREQREAERIALELHELHRRQIAWEVSTLTAHRQERSRLSYHERCVRWYIAEEEEVLWLTAVQSILDILSLLVSRSALTESLPNVSGDTTAQLPLLPVSATPFRTGLLSTHVDCHGILPSTAFLSVARGDAVVSSVHWMREATRVVRVEELYREHVVQRSEALFRRHCECLFIALRWSQFRHEALLPPSTNSSSFYPPSSALRTLSTRSAVNLSSALNDDSSRGFRRWVSESRGGPSTTDHTPRMRLPSAIVFSSSVRCVMEQGSGTMKRRSGGDDEVREMIGFTTPNPPMFSPETRAGSSGDRPGGRVWVNVGSADGAVSSHLDEGALVDHRDGRRSDEAPPRLFSASCEPSEAAELVSEPSPAAASPAFPGFFLKLGASSAFQPDSPIQQ